MSEQDSDEELKRAREAHLRTLTELSSDWYWEQDEHYRFVSVGVDSNNLPQAGAGAIVGRTRWDNPSASLTDAEWLAHRRLLEERKPFRDLEYSRLGVDGQRRWVSISGTPFFDAEGNFKGYRGIGRDITERKQAEEALRTSEERFRDLAQMSSDAYWEQDAQYRFTLMSDGALGDKSETVSRFIGKTRWELPSIRPLSGDWSAHRAMLDAHLPFRDHIHERIAPDGSRQVISVSGQPLFDSDGSFKGYRGTATNVTERNRAEEELRRFRVALDHSADMILLIDRASMRYVDVNETVCRLLGYTRAEMTALGPQDVLPVSREVLERSYDELIGRPQDAGSLRSYYRCKDGSTLPFESTRHVIRSGESYLIAAISRDIRDRLATENALRESETRFRTVFERSNAGIAIWNLEGRYIAVNRAHADFVGYTPEELMQLSTDETRAKDDPQWSDFRKKIFDGTLNNYTRDRRYLRRDGREVWGRLSVAPVRDPDGRVQYIISICTDITEAREVSGRIEKLNEELETRVRERTAELEGLVRELESFSYTISHDLRSPLRSMGGFAEILLQTHAATLPADAQRMLTRIHANARRMSDLLDGLLAFARLGRRSLVRDQVRMGVMADETWKELAAEIGSRPVRFERGGLPDSEGDPVLLKQVWANLLSNALKYSRGRDPAEIAVGWDPDRRAYFVRDNGAGFDMQYADKLFGVFSRLHTDEEFEGTGLGLAICERIVRRHGGSIQADARPGEGATFYFSL